MSAGQIHTESQLVSLLTSTRGQIVEAPDELWSDRAHQAALRLNRALVKRLDAASSDPPIYLDRAALATLRVTAGLSQLELGRRSGVSQGHISELERGIKLTPRPATIKKLADALEVPMAELLKPAHGGSP